MITGAIKNKVDKIIVVIINVILYNINKDVSDYKLAYFCPFKG